MVLEYADIGDLTLLLEAWPIPETLLGELFYQICLGVEYLHKYKVVHADIKPQNILLKSNGQIMIADFGLAYMVTHSTMTVEGRCGGTPIFMAPELFLPD